MDDEEKIYSEREVQAIVEHSFAAGARAATRKMENTVKGLNHAADKLDQHALGGEEANGKTPVEGPGHTKWADIVQQWKKG